jgi:light-regulated signal transduction histidine kinase (bacteriophytochrome)
LEVWGRGKDVIGQPLFKAIPELTGQGFKALLDNVCETGEPFYGYGFPIILHRNGKDETIYFDFVYKPLYEAEEHRSGRASGLIAVGYDVTAKVLAQQRLEKSEAELQELVIERTAELEKAVSELKRSNTDLEEFAYAASHDMKEPIRKIRVFADRLKEELSDKMNESQERLFGRLESAANRMNQLIEDLLAYSFVTRGKASHVFIDLNQKVQGLLEDLELPISEKGAEVQFNGLPTITGDKRQFQQLFLNLIGNSLKYSRPEVVPRITISSKKVKGLEIEGRISKEEADKEFHLITVEDNGIGFHAEDSERIFNMFTRLHGVSEYKGTGVGLSIVRKVVENHGGVVERGLIFSYPYESRSA